jgi:copper chaperone CopZ
MTIKNELSELAGITRVDGDPDKKEITIEWDFPARLEKIVSALKEINYPAAE